MFFSKMKLFVKKKFPTMARKLILIKILKNCMGSHFFQAVIGISRHLFEIPKWNKDVKKIRDKYDAIEIYPDLFGRIGETMSSYLLHLTTLSNPKHLKVLISTNYSKENKAVLKIMRRKIPIIMEDRYSYWIYIIFRNLNMAEVKYAKRNDVVDKRIDPEYAKKTFLMSEVEKEEARKKFGRLGIKEEYVCIHNRDGAYLGDINTHHKYRMFPISCYSQMAKEFKKLGIPLVRVGQKTEKRVDFDNCIEFANDYYDELLDIYLTGHCKFWIGSEGGAYLLPRMQNIPVACVNVNILGIIAISYAYVPVRDDYIYIIRKYYSKRKKRYLSLWEILMVDSYVSWDSRTYDKMEIQTEFNTEEEVYELAKEMNDRIDGTWVEIEEDKVLQEKYQNIMNEWMNLMGFNQNMTIKGSIGTKFLRDNKYLLDCQETLKFD